MTPFYKVTHVIFDVDGLLLDTERLYTEAIQTVLSEYGTDYPYELKLKCMGTKAEVGAQIMIDALKLPVTVDEYFQKINSHYDRLFPTANLLPGAERLVKHLHAHGIPIAIASGGSKKFFDVKIIKHKTLIELFSHIVLASTDPDVKYGKPAPDVFLVCAKRFMDSPDPKKCLVFEDAPNGVASARAAGMQVVLVPDDRLPTDMRKDATQVLTSLEKFQPELFGLPAFSKC